MSSENYERTEHIVPGQHIREYARGTSASQDDELQLAVKQYTPRYGFGPRPGDVTIIACHASGLPKELYEPLWDELFRYTRVEGRFKIRNIWIADVANQGASGVLNEHKLGSEPSFYDYARDILLMCNHFRKEMPRPLIGVGHSLGGNIIMNVALLHPRLLTTIVAIEPMTNRTTHEMNYKGVYPLTFRRDTWKTRQEAEKSLAAIPFCKYWDPSVMALFLKYGLRETSTGDTTRVTTHHQEAFTFARPAYPKPGTPLSSFRPNRVEHPDLDIENQDPENAFYNPPANETHRLLPRLRPSCYYIAGQKTHIFGSSAEGLAQKVAATGTGVGGSGGQVEGRVQQHIIPGAGHFVPFEKPAQVGQITASWLEKELQRWTQAEEAEMMAMQRTPLADRAKINDDWKWWTNHLFGKNSRPQKNKPAAKL